LVLGVSCHQAHAGYQIRGQKVKGLHRLVAAVNDGGSEDYSECLFYNAVYI